MFQPVKIAMTHPCQFCLGEAQYAPLEVMTQYGYEIYFCATCQAEYIYYNTPNIKATSVSLYAEVKDKLYRWTAYREGAEIRHTLWWVREPGLPGIKANRKMKCLLSYKEEMPIITPKNIQSKIFSWLPYL
jgi:hypothetical protein